MSLKNENLVSAGEECWLPKFVEDLDDLALRVGLPIQFHGGPIVDILMRRIGAGWNLSGLLEEATRVPQKVWINYKTAWHPVFLRPPECPALPVPKATTQWAEDFWRGNRIEFLANCACFDAAVMALVVYREIGIRELETARSLEGFSGIPATDWKNNLTTNHPAFCGKARGMKP